MPKNSSAASISSNSDIEMYGESSAYSSPAANHNDNGDDAESRPIHHPSESRLPRSAASDLVEKFTPQEQIFMIASGVMVASLSAAAVTVVLFGTEL